MRILNLLSLWIFVVAYATSGKAQTVPSSCNASEDVKSLYQDDADRMALRQTIKANTTWADSANIDPVLSQQYMDALIAVYNATSLPARDTVVTMFDLHTTVITTVLNNNLVLDQMTIFADTNLSWMKAMSKGQLITGDSVVDGFLSDYTLDSSFVIFMSHTYNGVAGLYFDGNYNLFSLGKKLESLPGVVEATTSGYFGNNSKTILDSIYPGFIELSYKFGWMDCLMGCMYHRFWIFRVYPDCSVEYVRSYGDLLPSNYFGMKEERQQVPSVWPNPFTNQVNIENPNSGVYSYELFNALGKKVQAGVLDENHIIEIEPNLPTGNYFLRLTSESDKVLNFHLLK